MMLRRTVLHTILVALFIFPGLASAGEEEAAAATLTEEDREVVAMLELLELLEMLQELEMLTALEEEKGE